MTIPSLFSPNIRLVAAFTCIVFFLIGMCLSVWRHDQALKVRLEIAEQRLEQMSQDHDCAIEAMNAAMRAREEIHEKNLQRYKDVEQALADNPDIDSIVIPEQLRMRLGWQPETADPGSVPPTSSPSGRH